MRKDKNMSQELPDEATSQNASQDNLGEDKQSSKKAHSKKGLPLNGRKKLLRRQSESLLLRKVLKKHLQ